MDITCLGSDFACQMSVLSSQLLIIGKKKEGNQGKHSLAKMQVFLSTLELMGGFSCGTKSVFPDSSISYKIGALFLGCSIPRCYKALSQVSSLNLVSGLLLEL